MPDSPLLFKGHMGMHPLEGIAGTVRRPGAIQDLCPVGIRIAGEKDHGYGAVASRDQAPGQNELCDHAELRFASVAPRFRRRDMLSSASSGWPALPLMLVCSTRLSCRGLHFPGCQVGRSDETWTL
ncbi:hypothetical protein PG999_009176 [Apiospora kogelbergensis]|uniref:Uncharacterized protein n=1 Tax=Apiospora kogelbergensis TaxID=1337665 RepID=A0AAW0QJZ2_9PEZI